MPGYDAGKTTDPGLAGQKADIPSLECVRTYMGTCERGNAERVCLTDFQEGLMLCQRPAFSQCCNHV